MRAFDALTRLGTSSSRLLPKRVLRAGSFDRGVGMVEVAVAIVVLGIILVGTLPLMVNSVRLAAQNAEIAKANRIVSTQLDSARAGVGVNCTAAGTPTVPASPPVEIDGLTYTRLVVCDAAKLAKVTVSVTRSSDTMKVIATATTKLVTG